MGLTTYADDVRVTSFTTEPVHTLSRVTANNAVLDNALEEVAQNTAKQEHSVFFAGQRAREGASWLDGTSCSVPRPSPRHHGQHPTRTSVVSCGRPTASSASFFQALVISILYTGPEALRLRPPDYEYLDRFVLGLGRKMMRGKATIRTKLEDGTEKEKRTVDRRKVWDFLGFVAFATELRAHRLQWYQNLTKDPTAHQNVLLSFSSEAPFESETIFDENGRIRESACGGARQWQEDVDGVGVFDDGAVFLEWGGGAVVQWFLDKGLLQDFGILDMNGIRAADRAVKRPPPSTLGGLPVLAPASNR